MITPSTQSASSTPPRNDHEEWSPRVGSPRVLMIGGLSGALAVLIGAFGAHGLPDHLAALGLEGALIEKRLDQFDVGARYHLAHAVLLVVIGGLDDVVARRTLHTASAFIIAGTVLFSGSLYVLVLTNRPWLGAITPIGGVAWIVGWFLLSTVGLARRRFAIGRTDL